MNRVIIRGLLGAAAGIAVASGAQAADLPVKAKPVEYVKVCSAYGAGFFYIPGTDICLRVGGYVFYEFGVKTNNGVPMIYAQGPHDRNFNYYNSRTSARANIDARQETAYGTLRAFMSVGAANASHAGGVGMDPTFLQFAGFTWGYANSFFSFGSTYSYGVPSAMLDWSWINTFAYTANLGNGMTASIAFEDPSGRRAQINSVTNGYGGRWMPEIVGNINVTQAWGRAQIMGAVHQVKPANMHNNVDSKYGYAIGAGIEVKTPQTGSPSNSFLLQGVWSKGAVDYTGYNSSPTAGNAAFGIESFGAFQVNDALISGGSVSLVKAWSVYAGYRHFWTPSLRTGFYGGYLNIDEGNVAGSQGELDVWQAGIGTIWSPVAGLNLSLELVYTDMEAKTVQGVKRSADMISVWSRIRRDF